MEHSKCKKNILKINEEINEEENEDKQKAKKMSSN